MQGFMPDVNERANKAKTPGPGVMAKIKMITKKDSALSNDIGWLL
jgi:hypothetical protein